MIDLLIEKSFFPLRAWPSCAAIQIGALTVGRNNQLPSFSRAEGLVAVTEAMRLQNGSISGIGSRERKATC